MFEPMRWGARAPLWAVALLALSSCYVGDPGPAIRQQVAVARSDRVGELHILLRLCDELGVVSVRDEDLKRDVWVLEFEAGGHSHLDLVLGEVPKGYRETTRALDHGEGTAA
mgnify:CR=1 FL=1